MPKKILAIDDEEDLLSIIKTWLESNGFQVETAKNGEEGLHKARAINPDLIILDIMMPKMDGFEVLSDLRGHRQTNTIPVVMLTSKGETENIMESERLLAQDFLIKPFEAHELLNMVHRYVRR
ncbi:MAG: response regulator [Candidatus Omnitrophica bacterium]|nr:response regulator [Candidatus Omnitrophota bacterium]